MTQIYLVSGFFGFNQLGTFNYFPNVSETLQKELQLRGLQAEVIEVTTGPTSSIRRRSLSLLEAVLHHQGLREKNIHFVGHSTGGLDIRLLLTPGVQLKPTDDEDEIAKRTRSVITIATPHYGTPLANFMMSLHGRNLLHFLTLLITSHPGRVGTYLVARTLSYIAKLDDYVGFKNTLLDSFSENLFRHITPDQKNNLWKFLRKIASDQGAILQLTPESIDLFNASVLNHPEVLYTCFLTAAPPPHFSFSLFKEINFYNIFAFAFYALIYWFTSQEHRHYPYPSPAYQMSQQIQSQLPFELNSKTNDGIVPILSQVWGHLGGVYVADHLDVIGQFSHNQKGHHYSGWLHSGARFTQEKFKQFWAHVAEVICSAHRK